MTYTNTTLVNSMRAHGGPAFPSTIDMPEGGRLFNGGMMLRDWFAGQFFAAAVSDRAQWLCHMGDKGATLAYDYVASEAYQMADAMLKAREAQP
jgi:hypothetical protein